MEKTNFSKRVIAGTLALVTVFGTAPASLQGVFAPSALIANAAVDEAYKLKISKDDAINFITSVKAGTASYDAASLKRADGEINVVKGDQIEIKSSVPLKINSDFTKNASTYAATKDNVTKTFGDKITVDEYLKIKDDLAALEAKLGTFSSENRYERKTAQVNGTDYAVVSANNASVAYKQTFAVAHGTDPFGTYVGDSTKYNMTNEAVYKVNKGFKLATAPSTVYPANTYVDASVVNAVSGAAENAYTYINGDPITTDTGAATVLDLFDHPESTVLDDYAGIEGLNCYDCYTYNGWVDAASATVVISDYVKADAYEQITNYTLVKFCYADDYTTYYVTNDTEATTLTSEHNTVFNADKVLLDDASKELTNAQHTNIGVHIAAWKNELNNGYEGTDVLEEDAQFKVTGSKGNYTYTFVAPDNYSGTATGTMSIEVATEQQGAKFILEDSDNDKDVDAADMPTDLSITDGTESKTTDAPTQAGANVSFTKFSTVTVTAKDPFQLTIDDKNKNNNFTLPTTSFDASLDGGKGMFVATFEMPESGSETTPKELVDIKIKKLSESYTYTVSGNKLLASTDKGSVTNAEAATIKAYYWKQTEDMALYNATAAANRKNPEAGKYYVKEYVDASNVENGTEVFFEVTAATRLLNIGEDANTNFELQIFKDGSETKMTDPNPKTLADANNAATKINGTGKYVAKLIVNGIGASNTNLTISTSFEVKAPAALTAEDVKLEISFKNGENAVNADTIVTNKTAFGSTNGVAEFNMGNDGAKNLGNATFTVTPTLVKKNADGTTEDLGVTATFVGSVSGSTVDKTYTFEVNVNDAKYGTYKFNVDWKLVPYEAGIEWTKTSLVNQDGTPNAARLVNIAQEDIGDLSTRVFESATLGVAEESKADPADVRFEYVKDFSGKDLTEDELDERTTGLPTADGKYTVYVIYNDVAKAMVYVEIGESTAVEIQYNEDALELTYGDPLDLSKYKLVEKKTGKEADKTDVMLSVKSCKKAQRNADNTLKTDNDGKYLTEGDDYAYAYNNFGQQFVDAETYIVTFSAQENAKEKKYSIPAESKQYVLKVAKKAITADMISFLPVEDVPAGGYDIVNAAKTGANKPQFFDQATGVNDDDIVTVTEGTKQTAVGDYTCTVKAADNTNYTGTAEAKWHIVKTQDTVNKYGNVDWVTANTTIYDNGRMHFEVKRNADDKITDGAANKLTVKEFGVIIDKTGKFDAMANNDPETAKTYAENYLVYGNGYATGSYTVGDKRGELYDASKQQVFKVNIKAQDVSTNIWARPFIVLADATGAETVYYGTTKSYNLTDVATEVFNLKCADGDYTAVDPNYNSYETAVREKELDRNAANYESALLKTVRNGYDPKVNKYYAYAQFEDLNKLDNGKEFKVSNFGVIIDKTGKLNERIKAKVTAGDFGKNWINSEEYKKYLDSQLVFDGDYQVGKYDPNNKYLKNYQFAANITPQDSVTGFWVRAYLDLGNGLIIYTEPKYYESASAYYAQVLKVRPTAVTNRIGVGDNYKCESRVAYVPDTIQVGTGTNTKTAKFKRKGIVLDKNGIYNDDTNYKLLIGSADGVLTGAGTSNDGANTEKNYVGKFTPISNVKANVRPYAVYDIDGKEVTVYGAVTTVLLKDGVVTIADVGRV